MWIYIYGAVAAISHYRTMVEVIELTKENIILPAYRGRLTEGFTYDVRNNTLLWVDIINAEAHRVYLDDKDLEKRHQVLKINKAGESIGAICKTNDVDTVLLCTKTGVSFGNFTSGSIKPYVSYPFNEEQKHRLRSNDANIDPWGNLWVGVMTDFPRTKEDGLKEEGFLYRIDHKTGEIKVMQEKTIISNGLAFTKDGKKLYWTDSPRKTVYSFDYDHETTTLSNKATLIDFKAAFKDNKELSEISTSKENFIPDGLDFTDDEYIYQAGFGTSTVVKFNLKGGVEQVIKLPAEQVTCVLVAGKDNDDIFINTAHLEHEDLDAVVKVADETEKDFGGHLFRYKAPNVKPRYQDIWQGKYE